MNLPKTSKPDLKRINRAFSMTSLIKFLVVREFGVTYKELIGRSRPAKIALARQVAMALAYELTGFGSLAIARSFGRTDHCTVLHARDTIKERCEIDKKLKERVASIRAKVKSEFPTDALVASAAR